jgi:hypothetical protein
MRTLREQLTFSQAQIVTEAKDENGNKNLFMEGIFVQGDKLNQNRRIYPASEIQKAVKDIQKRIDDGISVLGEADHPDDLQINLDRVSHVITGMWMNGTDGYGKLKILPTPMGNICKTLIESGCKIGVSSRGSGNVDDRGYVSDFEIITVDIVANPSAPDAYPDPLYEQIMNGRRGNILMDVATAVNHDAKAQKYLQEEILRMINDLNIRRK